MWNSSGSDYLQVSTDVASQKKKTKTKPAFFFPAGDLS